MQFKFILAIALILCAFLVLPASAYNVNFDLNTWTNSSVIVLPDDTLNFGFSAYALYLGSERYQPYTFSFTSENGGKIYCPKIPPNSQPLPWINYGSSYVPNLGIGTHEVLFTGTLDSNSAPKQITFRYTITADYNPAPDALINYQITDMSDTTVTYDVYCLPDENYLFTAITAEEQFIDSIPYLTSNETHRTFIIGETGGFVYSVAATSESGAQRKVISTYLYGRNEQPIEPTPTPTDTPVYPDRIQAFIQTFDYQNGNMLSGVNMSVYEVTENGDNLEIGNKIYSSINAESQTILTVKNNTEYFIENELTGYFAVKNENIASLDNRYGYLWNPTLINPLRLYYSRLDPTAQYNANFIVQDVNNNGIAGVSVTMDNSITKISNSIGGLTFNNVSAGTHTFTFIKNGYQSAQRTIDIQLQYAAFTQTLFKDDQIIQPTISPTAYPTTYPTVSPTAQPTLSPIDKPSNIMESVSFGFAKIFGVKTVENANYIFALMLILFPAVVAGGITHQALGFIAGGMIGFVFALAVGLIPIWVFFAMCLLAVIYFVLKGGNEGF